LRGRTGGLWFLISILKTNKIMQKLTTRQIKMGLFILMSITTIWSCRDNLDEQLTPDDISSTGILELEYEAEVISHQELENPNSATELEKIGAVPTASRSKVSIQVYEDGTSEWRI
jgi:hypothetical protein